MKSTDQNLIEQLKITRREIARRKEYFSLGEDDIRMLASLRELIAENINEITEHFYQKILQFEEMDGIIGDADTLQRLKNYQRHYILSLFDGEYDEDYVHSRLRIGVVHKRIGVDPKFYVSSVHNLNSILRSVVSAHDKDGGTSAGAHSTAIEKILLFDLSFIVDTYINSLMEESRRSKEALKQYADSLEEVISERTQSLREQASHDGLTGLLNHHAFYSELKRELSRGRRKNHSTALVYFDLDGFKKLNDSQGHKRGDEILAAVAAAMKKSIRESDIAARYGGDEFCIILPEGSVQEAEQLCQRLAATIKRSTEGTGISCSMGIATDSLETHLDANALVKKADQAMYEAKKEPGFSITIAK